MSRRCSRSLSFALLLLTLAVPAATVQAETYHFMTVFGSQCQPPKGKYVHSFATFVRATGCGNDWSNYHLEVHTISWLPATMDIKPWKMVPEEGDNYSLKQTLCWAWTNGADVKKWGPYQISCETYQRALHRIGIMNQDLLEYQAIDPIYRTEISNCIHAISGIDPYDGRTRYPLVRVGYSASEHIAEVFLENGLILDANANHCWLDRRMGLSGLPIETGTLEVPLVQAGIGRSNRAGAEVQFPDVRVSVCPDFTVPAGCRHCLGLR